MVELKECNKKCFCKDCDDEECWHAGRREADCPRYSCVLKSDTAEWLDCENCLWLEGYYADMRGEKNG